MIGLWLLRKNGDRSAFVSFDDCCEKVLLLQVDGGATIKGIKHGGFVFLATVSVAMMKKTQI